MALLAHYRGAIEAHPDLDLAASTADVAAITQAGRIAVTFDLEDSRPLDDDLDNIATLAGLGVRTLLPTYNHANRAGSGCLDATDDGLTAWGRAIVTELNAVGIVPDGTHCSARTGLDMCEISDGPVIYSHSCMRAVWDHPATSPTTKHGHVRPPAVSSESPASASSSAPTRPHWKR